VEHSSSSATALITDTRTVQVFAQGVIVCMTVNARALVTVLCYCVLKCLFNVYYYYLAQISDKQEDKLLNIALHLRCFTFNS